MSKAGSKISRVRVAKREANRVAKATTMPTSDSFQNFASHVGLGTDNQSSFAGYGFNPITRNRVMLDFAYRGSWLVRAAVDSIAEDMTREGVEWGSEIDPDDGQLLSSAFGTANSIKLAEKQSKGEGNGLELWIKLQDTIKWARLYGGAIAVLLVDGQDSSTPLDLNRVGRDSFLGLEVYDRWQVDPTLGDLVTDIRSPHRGKPKYYHIISDAAVLPRSTVHHSRVIRIEGESLPYWQRMAENQWGLSVLEPIFDRLVAFDSTTQGAAQLVYRAHLRTYKVAKLREIIAAKDKAYEGLVQQMTMMRMFQSNEGITLMDLTDEFEAHQFSFGGLSELLINFAQQVSGSLKIPMVRLYGQSPVGFNSTGESDWRNYYDGVKVEQKNTLHAPVSLLARLVAISNGIQLPDGFNFEFTPLWQLTHEQKASVASQVTSTIMQAFESGLIANRGTALKELKQSSTYTGIWTNITEKDIKEAETEPPRMMGEGGTPGPGAEGEEGDNFLPPGLGGDEADTGFLPSGLMDPRGGKASALGAAGDDSDGTGSSAVGSVTSFLPGRRHSRDNALLSSELERMDKETYKPLFKVSGYPVVIETKKGEARKHNNKIMPSDYGFFDGTCSDDGDPVDVCIGPDPYNTDHRVYIIEQLSKKGTYLQPKVMMGYPYVDAAEQAFDDAWPDRRGMTGVLRQNDLHKWLNRYRIKRKDSKVA